MLLKMTGVNQSDINFILNNYIKARIILRELRIVVYLIYSVSSSAYSPLNDQLVFPIIQLLFNRSPLINAHPK